MSSVMSESGTELLALPSSFFHISGSSLGLIFSSLLPSSGAPGAPESCGHVAGQSHFIRVFTICQELLQTLEATYSLQPYEEVLL